MTAVTALFNGPYDEALALTVEARNYVAYRSDFDQRPLAPGVRLQASFESLRMTTRLTQVMAWLLAQKALFAGEITLAQLASEQFALGGESICNDEAAEADVALPERLRHLLTRSRALYQRVSRLDDQVRRTAGVYPADDNDNDEGDDETVADSAPRIDTGRMSVTYLPAPAAVRRPLPAR